MFPRRAEDSLRVLIYLGIIVLFLGVLFLRFDEAATDFNSIQFVGPDAPTQNFIASRFGIEVPFFPALYDRNRKRGKSSLPADTMAWFAFFGAIISRILFLCLSKKRSGSFRCLERDVRNGRPSPQSSAPSQSSVAVGSKKMVRYGRPAGKRAALLPKTREKAVADQGDVGWPLGMLRNYSLLGVDAVHQRRPTDQHQEERNGIPFL